MARNIVLCLDGTGNQFKEHNSNVVKLFRILDRDERRQLVYYDPGVGTLADPGYKTPVAKAVNKGLGLAFGRGLTRNIEEAYSFLMDHYQDGDDLFLFGFSRGAYTARALAGFIHHCGLLEKGCQNLIPYAMKLFKKTNSKGMTDADWKVAARFRKTYGRRFAGPDGKASSNCPIHFLGLWDSVSPFGWILDPVFLPHTTNNASVQIVRHALAIDERRLFFRPVYWGLKYRDRQDVKEVWFAGVHSDVGGGYAERRSALAKIALEWMVEEAKPCGLLVSDRSYRRYVLGEGGDYVGPSALGPQHESLEGLWWPAELMPKRVWDPSRSRKAFRFPRPAKRRDIPREPRPVLHHTVLTRMESSAYRPPNLPSPEDIRKDFDLEGAAPVQEEPLDE